LGVVAGIVNLDALLLPGADGHGLGDEPALAGAIGAEDDPVEADRQIVPVGQQAEERGDVGRRDEVAEAGPRPVALDADLVGGGVVRLLPPAVLPLHLAANDLRRRLSVKAHNRPLRWCEAIPPGYTDVAEGCDR